MPPDEKKEAAPTTAYGLTQDATGAVSHRGGENSTAPAPPWTPDKLRQLSSALLMELFRRQFDFETEERDKTDGPLRKRRRRYDRLFALGVIGSYGFGRVYAEFRDIFHLLEFMPEVGKGGAFRALKDMGNRKIMWRVQHAREALRLFVNPRVESWILDKRIQDEAWKKKLQEWAALHGTMQTELSIPDMPLPDQTIMEALAKVNLSAAVSEVTQGNQGAPPARVAQVTQGNLGLPRATEMGYPGEPASSRLYNVESKRRPKRVQALNARAATMENELLESLKQFLRLHWTEERVQEEMVNSGGAWRKRAFFFPGDLAAAIADARQEGRFTVGPAQCVQYRLLQFLGFSYDQAVGRMQACFDAAYARHPEKVAIWAKRSAANQERDRAMGPARARSN